MERKKIDEKEELEKKLKEVKKVCRKIMNKIKKGKGERRCGKKERCKNGGYGNNVEEV
jgi:hypothetical protein